MTTDLRTLLAFAAINLLVDTLGNMCHNQLLAMERMVIPAVIATGHIPLLVTLAGIALAVGGGLVGPVRGDADRRTAARGGLLDRAAAFRRSPRISRWIG